MIFTLKIGGIFDLCDILILPLIHPQILPEVAHAEARDDRAHEGEAVQMQGVHLSDRHLRHAQQAHLVSPQGQFSSICQLMLFITYITVQIGCMIHGFVLQRLTILCKRLTIYSNTCIV